VLAVGKKFPEYEAMACFGNNNEDLKPLSNAYHADKWAVYIFYPKDFTFVCPTELVEFGKKAGEFNDRDAVLIGGSTDNEFCHRAWRVSHDGLKNLPYPLVAAQKLASDLGIIDPVENVCLRATFIVDPNGVIQWSSANALSVGRSVPETLRTIDALQSDELCPCNWKPGDEFLKV
jgi:lipoyl-dependent peroxiredoxin subunit C